MRKRLWRVDEFDGIEVVATPITGDSNDQRIFLANVENIREEKFEKISAVLTGDLSALIDIRFLFTTNCWWHSL